MGAPTPAPAQVVDLGTLFGQPGKSQWTPAELVQKCATLPGMSGALIALSDGLLVANQLPANLNGETIAAFLPQMFGRMSHYTRELKIGEPHALTLMVKHQPLQITKVGDLFFLAIGKAGERLPEPQLEAIIAQLDKQSKQS